jgi:hypothetical protein
MVKAAEVAVLGAAANNPHLSIQQTANYSGVTKTSIRGIFKCRKSLL